VLKNTRPELAEKLRVIWKSPLIPLDPLIWRKDLPDDVKERVKKFILSYGREGPDAARQRQVLANITSGWAPFRQSSDEQLLPFREMLVARQLKELEERAESSPESLARRQALQAELERLQVAVAAAESQRASAIEESADQAGSKTSP